MTGAVTLSLLLVLVPAVLSQVPTGCVKIRNAHWSEFLIKSSGFDSDRRNVAQGIPYQRWHISKDGNYYKIKLDSLNEELYESSKTSNGNYVFTWIPKTDKGNAAQWNIYKAGGSTFYIKNVKYGHCLMAKGGSWISAYGGCDGEKYEWKLEGC
uniref:Putative 16.3 kDa salivary protein n=1 Tax=Culex tarsalis TaxID=7177 RepID=A0A1Q3EUX2_CULTA